jgi:ADP-L-glycero-D-manno-heptose 6-epimerase
MKMITGFGGFIGSHYARRHPEYIGLEHFNAAAIIDNFNKWEEVDEIIHLGAISSTTETNLNKLHHFNVHLTLLLFHKAIEYQIPVKYASSASVYGNSTDGSMNPLNYYALTKTQIDYWVQDNIDKFKSIQGFRFFNVYGQGEEHKGNQQSPVSKFVQQAKEYGVIKVFEGSDKMMRDFVWVDDVIDVMEDNGAPSGIYDIGSGHTISFREVAEIIAKKYGAEIQEIPFPEHLKGKYQYETRSVGHWVGKNFMTVDDYINRLYKLDTNQTQSES